jgi:hypothetical protein
LSIDAASLRPVRHQIEAAPARPRSAAAPVQIPGAPDGVWVTVVKQVTPGHRRRTSSSTSWRRQRHSERNWFRRIVMSHPSILVPASKELMLAIARTKVSCTRSSARSGFRQSDIATARTVGMAASMTSRTAGCMLTA